MVDVRTPPHPSTPPPSPHRRSRGPLVALLVLVVVGLAAAVFVLIASGDDPVPDAPLGGGSPPVQPPPAAEVDPGAAAKAEILDAYRQSYDAVVAVGSDPKGQPDDPRLEQHKGGHALLATQLSIRRLRTEGHVLAGNVEVHPEVVELTEDTAVVEDCGIDVTSVVVQHSGEVIVPAGPPAGGLATATYRLIDGVWIQDSFTDEKRSCVPPVS